MKKILSIAICLVMLVGMLPLSAFAGNDLPPICLNCNYQKVSAVAPSCTHDGNNLYYKCSYCGNCRKAGADGKVDKTKGTSPAAETLPASHNFVGGICTVCGRKEGRTTYVPYDPQKDADNKYVIFVADTGTKQFAMNYTDMTVSSPAKYSAGTDISNFFSDSSVTLEMSGKVCQAMIVYSHLSDNEDVFFLDTPDGYLSPYGISGVKGEGAAWDLIDMQGGAYVCPISSDCGKLKYSPSANMFTFESAGKSDSNPDGYGDLIDVKLFVSTADVCEEHVFTKWTIDEENCTHYAVCDICGTVVEEEHVYKTISEKSDELSSYLEFECEICGYKYSTFGDVSEDGLVSYPAPYSALLLDPADFTGSGIDTNELLLDVDYIPASDANIETGYFRDIIGAFNSCDELDGVFGVDNVKLVYDLSLEYGGEEYHFAPGEAGIAEIVVGEEIMGKLMSGEYVLVHINDGQADIVPITSYDETNYTVQFDVMSLSPFAVIDPETFSYFGRKTLGGMEKSYDYVRVYDLIVDCAESCTGNIIIPDDVFIDKNELTLIFDAYQNDYGQHFWVAGSYTYYFNSSTGRIQSVTFELLDGLTDASANNDFKDLSERFLSFAFDGMDMDYLSEYDKALIIHDCLVQYVEYDEKAPNAHSAFGALVDGLAVCEGYAEAYQYLLGLVGIESHRVTGEASTWKSADYDPTLLIKTTEAHAWNLVKLDDNYYHIDTTWDDQGSTEDSIFHAYFCMDDTQLTESEHTVIMPYAIPECTDDSMFYFNRPENASYSVTSETMYESLSSQMLSNNGKATVYITDGTDIYSWFYDNDYEMLYALADDLELYGAVAPEFYWLGDEYHVVMSVYHTVEWTVPTGCRIVDIEGFNTDEAEYLYANSDGEFIFRVETDSDHYKGDDLEVKVGDTKYSPSSEGYYVISGITDDITIIVNGVYPKDSLAKPGKSIEINGGNNAKIGDVLEITSSSYPTNDVNIAWQWFLGNDPIAPAGTYAPYTVTAADAESGKEIKLRAVPASDDGQYKDFLDSNWVAVAGLAEPTLTVTVAENIVYDFSPVEAGTDSYADIRYSTNSDGAVTVKWYKYGTGVVDEENVLPGAPTDAGKYFVTVSTAATSSYSDKSVTEEFEIGKLNGGNPKKIEITIIGDTRILVKVASGQRYLIRPVESPAHTEYDDDEKRGWTPVTLLPYWEFTDLDPFTTYRVFTYGDGLAGENFGRSNEIYLDVTTLKTTVEIPEADNTVFVYNGEDQTYTIAPSDYYTVTGNVKKNAGVYSVTVSLKDKVHTQWSNESNGDRVYEFRILPKQITADMISVAGDGTFTYTGEAVHPAVTVTDGVTVLTENVDYTVGYHIDNTGDGGDPNVIGVGQYSVSVSAVNGGNYTGEIIGDGVAELTYTIVNKQYTGEPVTGILNVPVSSAEGRTFSLIGNVKYTNLPDDFAISDITYGSAFFDGVDLSGTTVTVNSDFATYAIVGNNAGVLIATLSAPGYDDITGVEITVTFTEAVVELEMKTGSDMKISSIGTFGKCLTGMVKDTSVTALLAEFDNTENVKIIASDGITELTDDAFVGTGAKIRLYDGDTVVDEITVILMGDIDGDGRVSSSDALKALKGGSGIDVLGEIFTYAGNLNGDDKISSAEALRILKYSSGIEDSLFD